MPPRLFPDSPWIVTPEAGRTAPPLWVRRLVIFRKENEIVREIQLKPGLNIVWSPDGEEGEPMGHGGGKTTFCRLLRYCLGEDSFAPEGQRRAIRSQFPEGTVGVEVVLNGVPWAVSRSLGDRRRDVVIENGTLESTWMDGASVSGITALRRAITDAIIGEASSLMPGVDQDDAWVAALAWASRDQECRFADHLRWRDPESDSHSPVRGLSANELLMVVRALVGALSKEELTAQQRSSELSRTLSSHRTKLERFDWQIERLHDDLSVKLAIGDSVPGTPIASLAFREAAQLALAKTMNLRLGDKTTNMQVAREERDKAQQEFQRLKGEVDGVTIRIEEREKIATFQRSELPEAHARLTAEKNPICPVCEVPIDRVLAEGCGISTATCDLHALQSRTANLRDEIKRAEQEISGLKSTKATLHKQLEAARQVLGASSQIVAALEAALDDRSIAIRAAQRTMDDAERYELLLQEKSQAAHAAEVTASDLDSTREALSAHRASVAESITRLSSWFDTTMRELVPGEIKGAVKLDGNGLALRVDLGGERSTAAINSLKVVAFDLAVLILSIEGRTHFPSFFIHDSPREADLGISIYSRLFEFARRLEGFGPAPLFQYIVTTTTEPPEGFRSSEWIRLKLRGGPASERLLTVDL
jgi:predicted  nucleic acid-binding Zn-ribbon protein